MATESERTTFIYGLRDPRDGKTYYVGKSSSPEKRFIWHLNPKWEVNKKKRQWVEDLLARGEKPQLVILDKVPYLHWEQKEQEWIDALRLRHEPLLNGAVAGGGLEERDPEERFLGLVEKNGPLVQIAGVQSQCHIWKGSLNSHGYGMFWSGEKTVASHRWAYLHFVGAIPKGLPLDHLCRNRACVNPQHLEPVTARENCLRGESFAAVFAVRTHCNKGHSFDGVRIRGGKKQGRYCTICKREADRILQQTEEYKEKRRKWSREVSQTPEYRKYHREYAHAQYPEKRQDPDWVARKQARDRADYQKHREQRLAREKERGKKVNPGIWQSLKARLAHDPEYAADYRARRRLAVQAYNERNREMRQQRAH